MADSPIPQTNPQASYEAQRDEIDAAVARVLAGGRYILGPEVDRFEAEFAAFVGARYAVGAASGTDALVLGLRALGVGPGDGVVTVSHTAAATVAAIELVGAVPVLVDVDEKSFTMGPAGLAAVLTRPPLPIKAVVPVHLYGHPADMAAIATLAARHGAKVLEDASQAHGAMIDGRQVGRFGDAAAFSLYPTKNLGAFGDAGVLTTEDDAVAASLRSLRQYGWTTPQVAERPGMNSRLDELQAAILRVKLARLAADNDRRRAIAHIYDAGLEGLPLQTPAERAGAFHVYHQYVVRTDVRDRLRARLLERNISSGVHYPMPVHLQPAYQGRLAIGPLGLATTESLASRILSLPMFPQLDLDAASRVVDAIRACST